MTDEAVAPPANEKPAPVGELWAVQYAQGGIPEEPRLFDSEANARRYMVEVAVASDIEPMDEPTSTYIGNDDDEVRLFGPIHVWHELVGPMRSHYVPEKGEFEYVPFTVEDNAAVEKLLTAIACPKPSTGHD